MELITLIGDIDENFYQLGLIDRDKAKDVHNDVKRMLHTPWKPVNNAIEAVAEIVLKNSLLKKDDYYHHLNSYAEGLNIPLAELALVMLVPELVSSMTKWAPGFIKGSLGCSSFFMRNEKQEVVHGRILDFPLQGSYDLHERAILYDLKGIPKTWGLGTSGIPYPSITLMTEDGMTLALHQKFTNVFNKDGISIFSLIFDLIKKANDKNSVLEYLKNHHSITTWCLYMSFKNGDVLAVDLMGKEIYAHNVIIPDQGILYFCNHLEDKTINQEEMLPTGFHQYNLMREEVARKKIEFFVAKKQKTELELIKMMTTPLDQKVFAKDKNKNYRMDTITPSSLTAVTMNPTSKECLYIGGPAPKLFRDNIIQIKDCFNNPIQKEVKVKKSTPVSHDYYEGMKSLMQAQKGFDLFEPQLVYHHLQLAIDRLEKYPEHNLAKFYFLVAQYMFESHPKVLMTLLDSFQQLNEHLTVNLNNHCLLFIGRLAKILNMPISLDESQITHPKLLDIHHLELKIPRLIFHTTTKNMIIPRIDILDVVYLYTT